jgi:hypothetical protein
LLGTDGLIGDFCRSAMRELNSGERRCRARRYPPCVPAERHLADDLQAIGGPAKSAGPPSAGPSRCRRDRTSTRIDLLPPTLSNFSWRT